MTSKPIPLVPPVITATWPLFIGKSVIEFSTTQLSIISIS